MKKVFLGISGIIFGVMSVVSAQNPALTRLYELLDLSMISNLTAMDIIHATLDSYEVSATTKVQLDTIDQIRTHISAQKIAIARSKIITVPDGYPSVSLSSMDAIFDTVHTLGSTNAPIMVIEFLDFQCPYCKKQHDNKLLSELRDVEFPGKVRTAAAMFPLTGKRHEYSQLSAESAECAYVQGGMESFYNHKTGLYAHGIVPTMDVIKRVATSNGLDANTMEACITEGDTAQAVLAQKNLGASFGVRGTPYSVVLDTRSGAYKLLRGAVPIEIFMDEIEYLYNYR